MTYCKAFFELKSLLPNKKTSKSPLTIFNLKKKPLGNEENNVLPYTNEGEMEESQIKQPENRVMLIVNRSA